MTFKGHFIIECLILTSQKCFRKNQYIYGLAGGVVTLEVGIEDSKDYASPCLCLCHYLSVSVDLTMFLSLFLYISVYTLSVSVSASVCLCVCLSVSISFLCLLYMYHMQVHLLLQCHDVCMPACLPAAMFPTLTILDHPFILLASHS